jgi:hypothetical protein
LNRRKVILLLGLFFLAVVTASPIAQEDQKSRTTPIRQVDHILIEASDPHYLFSFFTDTLQLPVAWPIADYAGFTSGGVAFGNVNVEVKRFPGQKDSASVVQSRFIGFAFEPAPLADSLRELEKRRITYKSPEPYVGDGPDGSKNTLWTTVTLSQFSDSATEIFLCEYDPSFNNVAKNRERLREQLLSRQGGPLGVESVKEIEYGATDLKQSRRLWQRLMEPLQSSAPGVWQVGGGPDIGVVSAKENAIQGLIISVKSLSRARAFLKERGLLGPTTRGGVWIAPSKIQGLSIKLVEKK